MRQEEKGKGKAGKGAGGRASGVGAGSGTVERDTPEGMGLGDGAWLAWRVRMGKRGDSKGEEESDAVSDRDDPGWDVVLPSLEEVEEVEDAMETVRGHVDEMGCGLHYDMSSWLRTTRFVIDRVRLYSGGRRGRDGGVDTERSYAYGGPRGLSE